MNCNVPATTTSSRSGTAVAPRPVRPATDVVEYDDRFDVTLDVPGVRADDLDIQFDGDRLWVRGQTRQEIPEGFERVRNEQLASSYEHSLDIGNQVDVSKIDAHMDDGVLTLTLPKHESAQKRSISVKVRGP